MVRILGAALLVPLLATLVVLLSQSHARADAPVRISISPTAVCALTDVGEIVCWGFDIPLVGDAPDGVFADLSLGPNDGCAITSDAGVACWGAGYANVRAHIERVLAGNSEADLVAIGLAQLLPPTRTDLLEVVVHPWRHYACARSNAGEIVCWGLAPPNGSAPMGDGFTKLISTGRGFCALDSHGAVTCWGDLVLEQVTTAAGPFVDIVPSGNGLCGIVAAGYAYCLTDRAPLRPGPAPPFTTLFRNVHTYGSQGCTIHGDGQLECVQVFNAYLTCELPVGDIADCEPGRVRFQSWFIPFTILYEGGPDRETTAARSYVHLFGDQAACAITTEGEIDCWSDFREGDPRHNVPERFRPQTPTAEPEPPAEADEQAQ